MARTQNDLGRDSIGKLLFRLSLPAITAQLINALYNIVDRAYIGHIPEIGGRALTGVGLTFPVIMIISAFSALVGIGGASIAAIRMGEQKNEKAEEILGNSFVMLLLFSVALTGLFLIFQDPLLMLFGASYKTLPYAHDYLTIYLFGTVFVLLSLGLNNFINTQGFAKTGMLTVLIGAVLNIALDPLFIFVFDMGVKGAALATILSQMVSAVWVLCFLTGKKTVLRIRRRHFRLRAGVILPVMGLGVSPFVMQSTESLVNIVLNSNLQKYGGDPAVGSMTIISSVMQIFMMPLMGLGQGAQPIIGYNYGAGKFDRVKKAFRLFLTCDLAFSTTLWAASLLFPQIFIAIFSNEAELVVPTENYMRIFMAGVLMMGAQNACQQTFLAVGQAKISLILALLRKIVLLIPLVFLFAPLFGVNGIFAAEPVADVLAATTTVCVFLFYSKRLFSHEGLSAPPEERPRT